MTTVAALRPDHQSSEAGRQSIPGLTAGCGRRVHKPYRAFFTALMGLRDAPSVITLHLFAWAS